MGGMWIRLKSSIKLGGGYYVVSYPGEEPTCPNRSSEVAGKEMGYRMYYGGSRGVITSAECLQERPQMLARSGDRIFKEHVDTVLFLE